MLKKISLTLIVMLSIFIFSVNKSDLKASALTDTVPLSLNTGIGTVTIDVAFPDSIKSGDDLSLSFTNTANSDFVRLQSVTLSIYSESYFGFTNTFNTEVAYGETGNIIIKGPFLESANLDIKIEGFTIWTGMNPSSYRTVSAHNTIDTMVAPDSNAVPVIDGQTAFVTNLDQPMTETEIRSHITAYDNEDGNITSSIVLVDDNYTANKTTKGSWIINYSVSDSAGNTTTLAVTVLVKDITKPIITGTSSYTQSMTTLKSLDTIKAALSASDNYDASVSVVLNTDGYSDNYNVPGTYNITFKSTDTSGNVGNYTVVLTVVDDVKPTISGPTTIVKGQTETLTTNEIKSQLTANDNLDGTITGSIVVVTDNYVGNGNKTGSYTIVFGVTDASGNTIEKTVTITVMDNIPPIFYVDNYFISIDQSLVITQAEIIDLLTRTNQISVTSQTTVTTTLNEYSGNENQVGMYAMTFLASSVDGNEEEVSVVVNVTGTEDPGVILDPVDDSVSWWQAIIDFFIWIWDNIFVKSFNWVIDLF